MRSLSSLVGRKGLASPTYQLTDRLHAERTARVSADGIVHILTAWLEELGADSPLVTDLARLVCDGDWPAVHAIADSLSVDVIIAA